MGKCGIVANPPHSAEVPVVIPAYKPGESLGPLVASLLARGAEAIIVVDDGSGPEFEERFRAVTAFERVCLVRHAVNLGKGAALKTGMNFALVTFPGCLGVVTADADGQHSVEDILRVAGALRERRDALILGVRAFDANVPFRSRAGNSITRMLMRVVVGRDLADTQTGLRGVPVSLIPHLLRAPTSGYEFELDMLMACKHQACPIVQVPIRTIYLDGNKSSHFRPLFDSMKIYFLLLRFSVLSLLTAVIDNLVFAFAYSATGSIAESQIAGRFVAMIFNYLGARSVVFQSQQKHKIVFPKYVGLVVANGLVSYMLIQVLHSRLGLRTLVAKLLAEALLFTANFAIQRDFVFTRTGRSAPGQATDWDRYYASVPATAKLTRKYTTAALLASIRRFAIPVSNGPLAIAELGGANSCFLDAMLAGVPCRSYDIVDSNRYGLSLMEDRAVAGSVVRLHEQDVLALTVALQADLVYSVGLIEHFDPAGTRWAVRAHFDLLRPGGIAMITYPTPTWLYRAARGLLETFGLWKFPDERPLKHEEVLADLEACGEVLSRRTLWPLILTQGLVVARKR